MKTINFFTDLFLVFVASDANAWIIRNATETPAGSNLTVNPSEMGDDGMPSIPKSRRKRYISQGDMIAILDYHNKVRANVFPPAANMEYMVSNPHIPSIFPQKQYEAFYSTLSPLAIWNWFDWYAASKSFDSSSCWIQYNIIKLNIIVSNNLIGPVNVLLGYLILVDLFYT